LSVSVKEDKEHIEDGQLLYVVVKHPQNIVEAVCLRVRNVWYKWAQVATDCILSVSQWPVLVDAIGAFNLKILVLQSGRI